MLLEGSFFMKKGKVLFERFSFLFEEIIRDKHAPEAQSHDVYGWKHTAKCMEAGVFSFLTSSFSKFLVKKLLL